jgi:hypothetical protein
MLGNWSIGDQKKYSTKAGPMPWAFLAKSPERDIFAG